MSWNALVPITGQLEKLWAGGAAVLGPEEEEEVETGVGGGTGSKVDQAVVQFRCCGRPQMAATSLLFEMFHGLPSSKIDGKLDVKFIAVKGLRRAEVEGRGSEES